MTGKRVINCVRNHVTVMMLSMFCGHVPRGYIQFLPRVLHFSAVHYI